MQHAACSMTTDNDVTIQAPCQGAPFCREAGQEASRSWVEPSMQNSEGMYLECRCELPGTDISKNALDMQKI